MWVIDHNRSDVRWQGASRIPTAEIYNRRTKPEEPTGFHNILIPRWRKDDHKLQASLGHLVRVSQKAKCWGCI